MTEVMSTRDLNYVNYLMCVLAESVAVWMGLDQAVMRENCRDEQR